MQFGDTLQGVALKFNMNPGQLKQLNKLFSNQVLFVATIHLRNQIAHAH